MPYNNFKLEDILSHVMSVLDDSIVHFVLIFVMQMILQNSLMKSPI